ncbi:MAG: putative regulatory component of sensory transduction system [Herbinix sp.]|jgi:diguanylate cyclase (GGDEF)-like protein|nr:putative regulatory component of sensory transduction system [Herbinix sp.]
MNFDKYEESIRILIDQVMGLRVEQPEETKNICKKIIRHGKKEGDSALLGFAYYYLAEAYFDCNQYDDFVKNLILGLEHQLEVPLVSLIAKSYNMLGISADTQGNISAAIDYYLTSLKYSRENGLSYEAGLVNTNIGQIYKLLKDYKSAILYLEKALIFFNKEETTNIGNRMITQTAIAICYLRMGELDTAFTWFHRIERKRDKYLAETHFPLVIYCFEVQFYNQLGEYTKRDELLDKLIHILLETSSLLDMYDEAFLLCEFLMESKRYDDLWRVLERIEKLTEQAGITNMQLRVLKYKLQYYKLQDKEAEYRQTCTDYVILSGQLEEENRTNAKRAIELRIDLEYVKEKQTLIQEENKLLQEKSERDPLTKLPNREKLNEYTEKVFEKAYHNGTRLGVEIFDIDFFKQYNDTYGHQAGDKCLKKIAQLLHSLMDQGIFCARYGGDEFIIIYENKSDDEIITIARQLKQEVMDLSIKHKNSNVSPVVTISQGIRNSVPKDGNKIWDYFYVADMAMYHVKRSTKNDILLLHKPTEQQQFDDKGNEEDDKN